MNILFNKIYFSLEGGEVYEYTCWKDSILVEIGQYS